MAEANSFPEAADGVMGLGRSKYRKFILLSRSRTGSNLLKHLIGAHPNAVVAGERFSRTKGRAIDQILDEIFSTYSADIKAVGFKVFYYHPLDDDSGEIWDRLRQITGLRVVHLTRQNILRTLVSRRIAGKTKIWMQSVSSNRVPLPQRRVSFTEEELIRGFQETRNWEGIANSMFSEHEKLDLSYEDLVRDTVQQLLRVTEFLSLAPILPRGFPVRQNPEPLSDLIINYEELSARFSNTEWASFFSG